MRKMRSEEFHRLYCSELKLMTMAIKPRRVGGVSHVDPMGYLTFSA
jgi:hypothetical protein